MNKKLRIIYHSYIQQYNKKTHIVSHNSTSKLFTHVSQYKSENATGELMRDGKRSAAQPGGQGKGSKVMLNSTK